MKKSIITVLSFLLMIALSVCIFVSCGAPGNDTNNNDDEEEQTFKATVTSVADNGISVDFIDETSFGDKASVSFAEGFTPSFELSVGQTINLTIQPNVLETYPVQVTATAISLADELSNDENNFEDIGNIEHLVFTGTVSEIYNSSILVDVTEDSAVKDFDKAVVSTSELTSPVAFNIIVGQTLEITILPEIRESYPVQVTAVSLSLVTPVETGEPLLPILDQGDDISFYSQIVKTNKFNDGFVFGKGAIPIGEGYTDGILISNVDELTAFVTSAEECFELFGNLDDAITKYGADYFADNKLVVFYTELNSGSVKINVDTVIKSENNITVRIKLDAPEQGTTDMAYYFILVELSSSSLEDVESICSASLSDKPIRIN